MAEDGRQSLEFHARIESSGLPQHSPEVVCAPVAQLDRACASEALRSVLRSFFLITNLSNNLGNLLFAQELTPMVQKDRVLAQF